MVLVVSAQLSKDNTIVEAGMMMFVRDAKASHSLPISCTSEVLSSMIRQ